MQHIRSTQVILHADGLMQERRNPNANALESRLSCTDPSMRINKIHP